LLGRNEISRASTQSKGICGNEKTAASFCPPLCVVENQNLLPGQIGDFFKDFVSGLNDTSTDLETALAGDHAGEFGGDIDVTTFKGARGDKTGVSTGDAADGVA
jgi:hypothetical protein